MDPYCSRRTLLLAGLGIAWAGGLRHAAAAEVDPEGPVAKLMALERVHGQKARA